MPVVNIGKHEIVLYQIKDHKSGAFCVTSEGFNLYINSKDHVEFRNFANSLLQLATDMEATNEPS